MRGGGGGGAAVAAAAWKGGGDTKARAYVTLVCSSLSSRCRI